MKAWRGVMKAVATHPELTGAQLLTTRRWSDRFTGWTYAQSASIDEPGHSIEPALPVDYRLDTRGMRCVVLPAGPVRSIGCEGVLAESLTLPSGEPFERRYCGPHHLLVAHERLTRRRGSTSLEGLPTCKLENLAETMTFVPAGRQFREWHVSDVPSRAIYIYIDPRAPIIAGEAQLASRRWPARMHFRSPVLWHTVLKLKAVLEAPGLPCPHFGAALGVVLAHELAQEDERCPSPAVRVGTALAAWQRRAVAQYIEQHLDEPISVATLASLARLSRYHFGRAFKVSFGASPHRFHSQLRLERAKDLLSTSALSITEIALEVGFQETSSFSLAFRRFTGFTPSRYRRSLLVERGELCHESSSVSALSPSSASLQP